MARILCLFNGSKKKDTMIQSLITEGQLKWSDDFMFIASTYEKELIHIACKYAAQTNLIISIGGDGTLNEIINGLLLSGQKDLPPIAIVPFGTGNDFFQSARLSEFETNSFLDACTQMNSVACDIGKIATEKEIRYFLNVADIGFGGAVVVSLNQFRQKFGAGFSYGLAILKTFLSYRRPKVRIESETFQYEGELLLAAACNGAIFGNGLHIHPGASIHDGQLNFTILGKVSLIDYLKNVRKVKRGIRIQHLEAHYFTSNKLVINGLGSTLHAETDGEYLVGSRFEISIIPQRIHILPY